MFSDDDETTEQQIERQNLTPKYSWDELYKALSNRWSRPLIKGKFLFDMIPNELWSNILNSADKLGSVFDFLQRSSSWSTPEEITEIKNKIFNAIHSKEGYWEQLIVDNRTWSMVLSAVGHEKAKEIIPTIRSDKWKEIIIHITELSEFLTRFCDLTGDEQNHMLNTLPASDSYWQSVINGPEAFFVIVLDALKGQHKDRIIDELGNTLAFCQKALLQLGSDRPLSPKLDHVGRLWNCVTPPQRQAIARCINTPETFEAIRRSIAPVIGLGFQGISRSEQRAANQEWAATRVKIVLVWLSATIENRFDTRSFALGLTQIPAESLLTTLHMLPLNEKRTILNHLPWPNRLNIQAVRTQYQQERQGGRVPLFSTHLPRFSPHAFFRFFNPFDRRLRLADNMTATQIKEELIRVTLQHPEGASCRTLLHFAREAAEAIKRENLPSAHGSRDNLEVGITLT